MSKLIVPAVVEQRAKAMGSAGVQWLAGLTGVINDLEKKWGITAESAMSGGTHAFAARAVSADGMRYVIKIDMPDGFGHADFKYAVNALKAADGNGYVKLFDFDETHRACLLEELGRPLKELGYTVNKQIEILCCALKKSWVVPKNNSLQTGSVEWFREFLYQTWNEIGRPCPEKVIKRAYEFLDSRDKSAKPDEYVMVHGDAHNTNILENLKGDGFKLIDPDGLFYEKACDLGVIMREWQEEYHSDPVKKGTERCEYLSRLTGVEKKPIWEWGYLQNVSTGLLGTKINGSIEAKNMLKTAEAWSGLDLF